MKKALLITGLMAGVVAATNAFAVNVQTFGWGNCQLVSGTYGQSSAVYECTDSESGMVYTYSRQQPLSCSGMSCASLSFQHDYEDETPTFMYIAKVEFDPDKPNTAKIVEHLDSDDGSEPVMVTSVTYDQDITDYRNFNYGSTTGLTQKDTTLYATDGETKMSETSETYTNGKISGKSEINYYPDGETKMSETSETFDKYGWIHGAEVTKYNEDGIVISKVESDGSWCLDEDDSNHCLTIGGRLCEVMYEYELDTQGNVIAKYKNVPVFDDDCYMRCDEDDDGNCIGDDYEVCDEGEGELTGYNREKYSADGETKLALYDANNQLLESYETPKPAKEVKRIYTVEEAVARVNELGGDTFSIKLRYK